MSETEGSGRVDSVKLRSPHYHGKDWSGVHVLHEASVEGLAGQVGVVLLKVSFARLKNTSVHLNYITMRLNNSN